MPSSNAPSSAPSGDIPAVQPRTTVENLGVELSRGERDLQMLVGTFSQLSEGDDERKNALVTEAGKTALELQKNKVRMTTARDLAALRGQIH
jgi:hypothetical protein